MYLHFSENGRRPRDGQKQAGDFTTGNTKRDSLDISPLSYF